MQKKTLKFIRGDDVSFVCNLEDNVGNPLNLQGSRFDLHARDLNDEVQIRLSSTENSILVDGHNVTLIFSNATTQELPVAEYDYDLQMTDSQGKRKTILGGKIILQQDYTRV